ncbi:hypothetical protein [Nonomuraea fuscirosea]
MRADWQLMSLGHLKLVQRKGEGLSEQYRGLMERG